MCRDALRARVVALEYKAARVEEGKQGGEIRDSMKDITGGLERACDRRQK